MGAGYNSYYTTSILDTTQALGAQTVDVSGSYSSILDTGKERYLACRNWQLQFAVSGETHSGEVEVAIKSPGADEFCAFSSKVDLTSTNLLYQFSALAGEIQLTPTDFDGTSYSVFLAAS